MEIKPIFKGENVLPIVFAFNDEYSKYFAVTLQSIITNSSKDKKYDIVIFNTDIEEYNKNLLYNMLPDNFNLRFFNISIFIKTIFPKIKLKALNYWSIEMYYRIFIPFIMPKYNKVLYLDSDTIIEDSLESLFSIDCRNKKVLVVKDSHLQIINVEKERLEYNKDSLKLKNPRNYFNSGMILFNIQNIDLKDYQQKILKAFENENLLFPDQDILNLVFTNNTKFISCEWNFCCGPLAYDKDYINKLLKNYSCEYKQALKKPKIIHYTTPRKPWNYKLVTCYERFWKYARLTAFYEDILYEMNLNSLTKNITQMELYVKLQQEDKKILLWGASLFLEDFIKRYKITNNNIIGIIDKNPEKNGKFLGDYKIFSPKDINKLTPDEIIITIINSPQKRSSEIKKYLSKNFKIKIPVKVLGGIRSD